MDFKWQNPPKAARTRSRNGEYDEVVERLVNNPGKWARLLVMKNHDGVKTPAPQRAATQASMIRNGRIKAFETEGLDGSFEAQSVDEEGKGVVYVRFVAGE